MSQAFRALVIRRSDGRKNFVRAIEMRRTEELPPGDLLIRVEFSSLNYKDGLSCAGNPGVTRRFPHTPGIDAAGVVEESRSDLFKVGTPVVVAGTALGTDISGGFGQYVRVPAAWAVRLPQGLSLRESMIYGTAGFTAALAVQKLIDHGLHPEHGPIAVTGASGGVGSVSVALLAKLGYRVVAITGKPEAKSFLTGLGAADVRERDGAQNQAERPLLKEVWGGGIDTVGGEMLASVLKSSKENGAVAATGMVASQDLPVTVMPFILRGISLLGINAQVHPAEPRRELWRKLAGEWRLEQLESIAVDRSLDALSPEIDQILAGRIRGRVVVDMR